MGTSGRILFRIHRQRIGERNLLVRAGSAGRVWSIARTALENPLAHGHLLLVLGGLAVFLTLSYLGLYALASLTVAARDAPPDNRG